MEHVYWIGGGTGSGKTTVAHALAARHGLRAFHVDSFWYAHDARLGEPQLTPEERWIERTPERHADDWDATSARRIPLVLQDLARLPSEPRVLVEGPQVLPDLLPAGARAVFLVPTREFQHAVLAQRPMPPTSDARRALANRIERDRIVAERIATRARARGLTVVHVDGTRDVVPEVEAALEIEPAANAHGLAAARRWENECAASNIRSWLASPEAPADAPPPFPWACECGRLGCGERVALTIDEFGAREHVLAPGHAQ